MADGIMTTRRTAFLAGIVLIGCMLGGCSSPKPAPEGYQVVNLGGTAYTLELVADDAKRTVGLGGRTEIAPAGGMLFSFRNSRKRSFLMRDCLVDIDILFLDAGGRIVAMHHMPVEPPREDSESMTAYEARLKKYSSKYDARYAIEIRGGLLETMGYTEGDKIKLDFEYLKSVTQ